MSAKLVRNNATGKVSIYESQSAYMLLSFTSLSVNDIKGMLGKYHYEKVTQKNIASIYNDITQDLYLKVTEFEPCKISDIRLGSLLSKDTIYYLKVPNTQFLKVIDGALVVHEEDINGTKYATLEDCIPYIHNYVPPLKVGDTVFNSNYGFTQVIDIQVDEELVLDTRCVTDKNKLQTVFRDIDACIDYFKTLKEAGI